LHPLHPLASILYIHHSSNHPSIHPWGTEKKKETLLTIYYQQ
jgi:hypothetical protein